ncbi:class I SAM-dependent methyltransferase [Saccharothrix sp. S26]|uniref:class I SAM-dependent methyltransferase n=1 Tax=Saccharothrix sp. S26 TaxID=2907215 RepID=UPI001F3915C5|nr:class I SAM-dependent methyltransferase [Saccharothrix sp. S26]MCE6998247.1 class I SAM-dependent methyltransferase [Saccharothrix sp. S26]
MGTDWQAGGVVATGFDEYDDLPERVLGYPTVFSALRLGDTDVRTVLDYGCGPGKISLRVAEKHPVQVEAVDISPGMLEIARTRRAHPRIRYHLLTGPRLDFLADDSVDAAMCCYVLLNIGDLERIRAIVAEVHRVLRPGGRFAVLDTNPDTTGTRFSTFISGEPGVRYEAGQQRRVLLHLPGGGVLELLDHHWPRQTYVDLLTECGFRDVTTAAPLLGDVPDTEGLVPGSLLDVDQPAEATRPPFLITSGEK